MVNLLKKNRLTKTLFFVIADIIFVVFSVWFSFLLRFEFQIPQQYYFFVYRMMALAIFIIIPVFYFHKLYSFTWSYVSTDEIVSLFRAATISFVLLGGAIYVSNFSPHFVNFPRSVFFISYVLVLILCSGIRFSKRIYLRIFGKGNVAEKDRTLIVGAGDAGEQILRSILSSNRSPYFPVGFVDDSPIKKGVLIHGLRVLGKISDIPKVAIENNIKQLIIALPSANSKIVKNAVDLGREAKIRKIKIAPALSEIIRGEVSFKNLKDIDLEDLLNRAQVNIDTKQIYNFIKGKTVLITGAAGSIGSELCRQVSNAKPGNIVLLDQDETGIFNIAKELERILPEGVIKSIIADVADEEKIRNIFNKYKPQIVFHAAAYKHVPLMEANPDEAVKNNILGTKNVAKASIDFGAENFIFISTDKAVNPTSVMGASKRVGEMICQAFSAEGKTKFVSVRFGNVLNSRGSVIPIFKEQIRMGGPVQVTHPEMKRYFMLISEACLLVMQAGAMGEGGEVFVLDMGKPIKIFDLAKEMIRLSGLEPDKDIAIVFTGVRPGEKLFEEMLTAEEGTIATQNQNIFMAKLSGVNKKFLEDSIVKIVESSKKGNREQIIIALKNIVPRYNAE